MKGPRDFLNSAPMSNLQAADPLPEDRSADSYRYVSRGDALVTDPLLDHQRGQDFSAFEVHHTKLGRPAV